MRPRVVICGSFHRAPDELRRLFKELEATGCRVLSPLSFDFEHLPAEFVKTQSELDATPREIESLHLRAIKEADFVFLHAPNGYVGISAAFEIGYAEAIGKPVYSKDDLSDEMLKPRIKTANSVFEALEAMAISSSV